MVCLPRNPGRGWKLTHTVNLTRRLADMEKQQSEVSTTEIFNEPQVTNMDDFIFNNRIEESLTTDSHGPLVQTSEKPDKTIEHQVTSDAAQAMTFVPSMDFMNGQDLCVQPVQHTERHDSAIEPRLFDDLFLPNPSDTCSDTDMSMFDTQGNLGGAVAIEPLKKTWPLLDLSELICADL